MSDRIFFHTEHRNLWDWMSEHPGCGKAGYPPFRIASSTCPTLPGGYSPAEYWKDSVIEYNSCYPCLATAKGGCQSCEHCPLSWQYTEVEKFAIAAYTGDSASNCAYIYRHWMHYTDQYRRLISSASWDTTARKNLLSREIKLLAERIRDMPIREDYDGLIV